MKMQSYASVPAYIAAAPKAVRGKLRQLRALVKALAPAAEEKISYGMPAYEYFGRPLVYFAAFKNHVGFYPASGAFLRAYAAELRKYETGKGTVRFPLNRPLPTALLRKLIAAKVAMNKKSATVCSRGHAFIRTKSRPTCPVCWPGRYRK